MQASKHEFALFWQGKKSLIDSVQNQQCIIDDPSLFHRLRTVLRIKEKDEIILFDRTFRANAKITAIEKKSITTTVTEIIQNNSIEPSLTFLLPILKRDALHETVYSLTEVGCTIIQLITTKKIHGSRFEQRELEKLEKIIIAAAEQSKNFNVPKLLAPISLDSALLHSEHIKNAEKIFFDPSGISCNDALKNLDSVKKNPYFLLIGPEGDLTQEEKDLVAKSHFQRVKLTQTILRAQQAATLGAGIIRSWLNS